MKPSDIELSRLALARGWLTKTAAEESLKEADRCQAMGLNKGVDDVFVEKGYLKVRQISNLRQSLGRTAEPRIGGFEIIRRIGFGGAGSVFEARQVRLNQRVALKILYPRYSKNSKMTRLFIQEARTLARLNHSHLVHALDAGRDGQYFYLAMEYVDGENLQQYLARRDRMELMDSLTMVKAVCSALSVLEEHHLVHRDVKPANILLEEDGNVKLADLGLLKDQTRPGDSTGEFVSGTPHYVAPERARGGEGDIRSDLYSLGATWYHSLAGRPPFLGGSTREILRAHCVRQPIPLSRTRSAPSVVEKVVHRWLAKDPEERPQTTAAALDELRALERHLTSRRARLNGLAALGAVGVISLLVWLAVRGWPREGEEAGVRQSVAPVAATGRTSSPPTQEAGSVAGVEATRTAQFASTAPERAAEEEGGQLPLVPRSVRPAEIAPAEIAPADDARPEVSSLEERQLAERLAQKTRARPTLQALFMHGRKQLSQLLHQNAARVQERYAVLDEVLAGSHRRFVAARPLLSSFAASASGLLVFKSEEQASIAFRYWFNDARELGDFRAPPGSVRVQDGVLSAAVDSGAVLDTIYWLTPPLRIDGQTVGLTGLSLRFGELGLTLVPNAQPVLWNETFIGADLGGDPLLLPPGTSFTVRFLRNSLEVRVGRKVYVHERQFSESGRLLLYLARGGLSTLYIEGSLDPAWMAARLRILSEQR